MLLKVKDIGVSGGQGDCTITYGECGQVYAVALLQDGATWYGIRDTVPTCYTDMFGAFNTDLHIGIKFGDMLKNERQRVTLYPSYKDNKYAGNTVQFTIKWLWRTV